MIHGECVYSKNIICYQYPDGTTTCTNLCCGWNPPVARARLDAIRNGGLKKDDNGILSLRVSNDSVKENEP